MWNVVTIGLRHAHKFQDAFTPIAGIEAEFVLQAHDIARAVVGNISRQAICVRAVVIDHMYDAWIVIVNCLCLLNRCHR